MFQTKKKQIDTYFEKYPKISELIENNQLLPDDNPKQKELINRFDLEEKFLSSSLLSNLIHKILLFN